MKTQRHFQTEANYSNSKDLGPAEIEGLCLHPFQARVYLKNVEQELFFLTLDKGLNPAIPFLFQFMLSGRPVRFSVAPLFEDQILEIHIEGEIDDSLTWDQVLDKSR